MSRESQYLVDGEFKWKRGTPVIAILCKMHTRQVRDALGVVSSAVWHCWLQKWTFTAFG